MIYIDILKRIQQLKPKLYGEPKRNQSELYHKELQEVIKIKDIRRKELVSYNGIVLGDPVVLISTT